MVLSYRFNNINAPLTGMLFMSLKNFVYLFYTNRKCIFTSTILPKSCSHQTKQQNNWRKKNVFEQICSREGHFTEDQVILIVQSSCATWESGVFYLNSTCSRWKIHCGFLDVYERRCLFTLQALSSSLSIKVLRD